MKHHALTTLTALAFFWASWACGQTTVAQPEVSEAACPLEVISVATPDQHQAAAVVRKPPGAGPFPAIVFLHGGLGQQGEQRLKEEARRMPTLLRFLAAGYVTVNATFRNRTEDPQTRDALVDCLAVIAHVKKRPEVDPKSVVVFGGSGGGSLALELAGETELCAVVAGEPASILFTGMLTRENVKDRKKSEEMMNDPKRFYTPELEKFTREKVGKINCPILIVHGDQHAINKINHEVVIPELKRAEKNVEVILYPGQPHGFYNGQVTRNRSPEAVLKCFADCQAFFKKHLPTQPTPIEKAPVEPVAAKKAAGGEPRGRRKSATGDDKSEKSHADSDRARQLFQKQRSGEKLSAEEEAELQRARDSFMKQRAGKKSAPRPDPKPVAAPEDPTPPAPAGKPAAVAPATPTPAQSVDKRGRTPLEPRDSTGLTPLSDFAPDETYKGHTGGLYGHGRNVPPPEHLAAAIRAGEAIQPLDENGRPAPGGKIVVIANGPSDTKPEFDLFIEMVRGVDGVNPLVVFVNTAQGGQEAGDWAVPARRVAKGKPDPWEVQAAKLGQSGVTAAQVQVVWMKQSRRDPATLGEFPRHVEELQQNQAEVIRRLKETFPNLRLAYLSSRTFAGYAVSTANPEPHGYEWAWANQWLIQEQIDGAPALNHDPARGAVKAPVILWGPYLWTDGVKGRKSDGLVYLREDAKPDGMHPSESGCRKVAGQLLQFFKTDPASRTWFLKPR